MAIAISAAVLTAPDPAPVQITITGLTGGDAYTVVGMWDGYEWPVPGGESIASTSTVILVDNRAPLNCEVVYQVTVAGDVYTTTPVIVSSTYYCVLQSLDGSIRVGCEVAEPHDQRSGASRTSFFAVDGRTDMPGRFDRGLAARLQLEVEVGSVASNKALLELLEQGGAIVRRNDGMVTNRGIPPVEIYGRAGDYGTALLGAVGTMRRWVVPVQVVGDPEPGVILVAFDWGDVKSVFAGQTWADFKTFFAGQTWGDVRAFDWGVLL